jgi:iron complex transport system substrate-binding protein
MTAPTPRPLGPVHDPQRTPVLAAATRRQFLGMVAAAGFLAACGSDGDDDGDGAAADTAPAGRIEVTNQFGTFEVPREPQRVIGWEGRRDLETALALGLVPIAVGSNAFDDDQLAPFIDFDPEGVEVIEQTEPNLELIASLRPDLILTRDSNIEAFLDELRPLAPLVPVTPDGPWRTDLEGVAEALQRSDRLAEVLAVYDEKRDEIRARHAERIDSSALAIVQYLAGDRFYASSTEGFYLQANTLADLGGTQIPFIEEGGPDFENDGFSIEQVEELAAADAILLIANEPADRAELDASELWLRLPAVTAGRVVETDFRTNYGSVYAATAALDLLDQVFDTLA